MSAVDPVLLDPRGCGLDEVGHEPVDERDDRLGVADALGRVGEALLHRLACLPPERDLGQHLEREDPGAQAVVEIVVRIGDLVGDVVAPNRCLDVDRVVVLAFEGLEHVAV